MRRVRIANRVANSKRSPSDGREEGTRRLCKSCFINLNREM